MSNFLDIFEERKVQKNLTFPKGSVIFYKGKIYCKLNHLVKGKVDYIFKEENKSDKYIVTIEKNNILIPSILMDCYELDFEAIADDDSIINSYPLVKITPAFFKRGSV